MLDALVVTACGLATALAGIRWLRVAQREHYLADAASRFFLRWWLGSALNGSLVLVAAAAVFVSARWPATALATAVVVAAGPIGLGLKGRTSPLAWTRRLRTLAAVWAALQGGVLVAGVLLGQGPLVAAAAALAAPVLVDLACVLTAPLERALASRHVDAAAKRLRRVAPRVVAITGSYGKTSTKGYVTHLVGTTMDTLASPASFNNRAGLARAVNENLSDGTEVFVAEMGTYGRGEISELCSWTLPEIGVITAIGPVHLERFRTEDAIVRAKAEILRTPGTVVLATDDSRLAALADRCQLDGKKVWRVSEHDADADVLAQGGDGKLAVTVKGTLLVEADVDARPGNVGCAVAVALALGLDRSTVASLVPTLPTTPHRLEAAPTAAGRCLVLDDTYNSNPSGAAAALEALDRLAPPGGRKVVVSPGMVELGARQGEENERFARAVAAMPADLVVVGRTNRRALLRGAHTGAAHAARHGPEPAEVAWVADRDTAVAWVRDNLGDGDIVLFENDLPDHYP